MKNLFVLLLFILGTISCNGQSKAIAKKLNDSNSDNIIEEVYRDVNVAVAKKMVEVPNSDVLVLDVRTDAEIKNGMIKNAIHIDYNANDFRTKIDKLDRNKSYLVYCHAGGRSKKAAEIMKSMGFKSVNNLADGYRSWNE